MLTGPRFELSELFHNAKDCLYPCLLSKKLKEKLHLGVTPVARYCKLQKRQQLIIQHR